MMRPKYHTAKPVVIGLGPDHVQPSRLPGRIAQVRGHLLQNQLHKRLPLEHDIVVQPGGSFACPFRIVSGHYELANSQSVRFQHDERPSADQEESNLAVPYVVGSRRVRSALGRTQIVSQSGAGFDDRDNPSVHVGYGSVSDDMYFKHSRQVDIGLLSRSLADYGEQPVQAVIGTDNAGDLDRRKEQEEGIPSDPESLLAEKVQRGERYVAVLFPSGKRENSWELHGFTALVNSVELLADVTVVVIVPGEIVCLVVY